MATVALLWLVLVLSACGPKPLLSKVSLSEDLITPNADHDRDILVIQYDLSRSAEVSIYFEDQNGNRTYYRDHVLHAPSVEEPYQVYFAGVVDGYTLPGEQFEGVSLKLLKTGFYDVWRYENPETAHEVPRLKPGEKVKLSEVEFVSSARSAPRASASSLIMRMDKAGIGRPSSNGKLLETLEDRGYVKQGMSRFGMYVTMLAREGLGETLNLDTTQRMEEALQELLDTPQKVLDDRTFEALDSFYQPFAKRLDYLRNIGAQFGRDAGNVRGFLDKVHYKKVSGIYGISEKEDADLQGALEACRPGFFRPWGSVSYFGRALPDHTGVFVCFWWRDHPKQKQRDLVGRLYYLFQDREGNPMTMMVSMLGTSNEEIPGMLDRLDWAAKKVMGRPVMGYPEAWGAFIGILRESQRQEMRLVFDPDGSFPILNRADGRNTVHALVFGASNTD